MVKLRCALVAAGGLLSGVAAAEPGDHIEIGDTVVTPSVSVGLWGSDNPFQLADPPQPGFAVATQTLTAVSAMLRQEALAGQFAGRYSTRTYLDDRYASLNRYDTFQLSASVDAAQYSILGLRMSESLGQQSRATGNDPDAPYTRQLRNRGLGLLAIRPRPESGSELWVGGRYSLNSAGIPDRANGGFRHLATRLSRGPQAELAVRTTPTITATVLANLDFVSYGTDSTTRADGRRQELRDARFARSLAGVRVAATDRLQVVFSAGYGAAHPSSGPETTNGLIASSLTYGLEERLQASVKYQRGLRSTLLANIASYDQISTSLGVRLSDRFSVDERATATFQQVRSPDRTDITLKLGVGGSLHLQRWGQLRLGYGRSSRFSSVDRFRFQQNTLRLDLTVTY